MPLNVRIGFFLALRAIRRASLWTTSLIIFVMVLTFLNLVVISGILVGLMQGAVDAMRVQHTGDIIITTLADKHYIKNSQSLIALMETMPEVVAVTARYREGGRLEAGYQERRQTDLPNIATAQIAGIDPIREHAASGLADKIIEGEFLEPGDFDKIVLGNYLLKQYMPFEAVEFPTLEDVTVGSKIRVHVGDAVREVEVKGILRSKVDQVALRGYMVDTQFRSLIGRTDGNVMEMAIKLSPGASPEVVRDRLLLYGAGEHARVQTFDDALPQAFRDIINTFNILGTMFSSIGLVVASITIFIVIFVNALTRRKYIGILKGIGISDRAVELSYVFQSIFYAVIGSAVGLILVYGFFVPYFAANPIDFPFSDGILVAPYDQTIFRAGLLVLSTIIAGYIPSRMIIRKNTLDSILGRN